jgi:hydroxymethylpyrimidine pyrophosphatase-like HAD family hydrolase
LNKIQAIIADVDGVMVGKDPGVNFPLPHEQIIQALKHVSQTGVPIVLCTAKFGFAVKEIALRAELSNPHITDGGALITRFSNAGTEIIKQHEINPNLVHAFAIACLKANIYFELCSAEAYYIDKSQVNELTDRRTRLLQQKPKIISILDGFEQPSIIKTVVFISSDEQKEAFEKIMDDLGPEITYIWSHHPYLEPYLPAIMTRSGVSKESATKEIAEQLSVDLSNCLGIGDSESDWNFMSLCGSVGVVGTKSEALMDLAKTKGENQFYLAPDVSEHGLLEILKNFNII